MEKIYVGKGTKRNGPYGEWTQISINLTQIKREGKEFIKQDKNGDYWVNLNVNTMRNPDKWNNTETVTVDTWKPKTQEEIVKKTFQEDIPF